MFIVDITKRVANMVTKELLNIARAYSDSLQEFFDIECVYLFGSCVVRENWDSEIDIAVVSKDFTSNIVSDRLKLMRIRRQVDTRIEPHPINIKDFTLENAFAVSIIETGIKIS